VSQIYPPSFHSAWLERCLATHLTCAGISDSIDPIKLGCSYKRRID